MSHKRIVTELDFRAPDLLHAKVEDYEFRDDGALVRKDRWETALRSVACSAQVYGSFEIDAVTSRVELMASRLNEFEVLLNEVRGLFTRDDDLPGDLLLRIDKAIE